MSAMFSVCNCKWYLNSFITLPHLPGTLKYKTAYTGQQKEAFILSHHQFVYDRLFLQQWRYFYNLVQCVKKKRPAI